MLGENALLARVLLEGVGAFSRALRGRYRASGRLMYAVLIPLLERLADPCPSVSAAAAAAVGSLCVHSGYASFDELVGPSTFSAFYLYPLLRLPCLRPSSSLCVHSGNSSLGELVGMSTCSAPCPCPLLSPLCMILGERKV